MIDRKFISREGAEYIFPVCLERETVFPPPWNIYEHPEKTAGWVAFQLEMQRDPEYYNFKNTEKK